MSLFCCPLYLYQFLGVVVEGWLATVLTPIAIGRKYPHHHPVVGTMVHHSLLLDVTSSLHTPPISFCWIAGVGLAEEDIFSHHKSCACAEQRGIPCPIISVFFSATTKHHGFILGADD
jgi:hypothetical protein